MFREKLLTLWLLVKAKPLSAVLFALGAVFIIIGIISVSFAREPKDGIIFETNEASASSKIIIDVAGAVVKPGVYELLGDSRIQDALVAAGGLSSLADRDYVSRNLNLALKLKDGVKIYIPKAGESVSQKTQNSESQININTASLSQLDKLPGIGPVTGQKIIDNRPYQDIQELLNKKIVGQKVFEQIKERITVY